jgi:hypothetical protein
MSTPFQIQIPVPCHENWDAMTPQEKGKFCGVCAKKVVDFSGYSKTEVVDYLQKHAAQKVCGRIPESMLDIPKQPLPAMPHAQRINLSRFAFAAMLVFGNFLFGCGQNTELVTKGEVAMVQPPDSLSLVDSLQHNISLPVWIDDSLVITPEPITMGMPVWIDDTLSIAPEPIIMGLVMPEPIQEPVIPAEVPEPVMMGEPALIEEPEPIRPPIMGKMICVPQPAEPQKE